MNLKKAQEAYEAGVELWNSLPGPKMEDPFVIKYCFCEGEIEIKDMGKTKFGPYHRKCGYPIKDEE